MPQLQRILFLITLLSSVFAFDAHSQCGTLAITGVTATPVSCNGGSDGTLTIQTSGGTGPFTYSNGASTAIGGSAVFGSSSNLNTSTSGTTSNWWSPGSCTDGSWLYSSASGCPAGSARFSRNVAFAGCFLRSPQTNMNGVNLVTITFDVSHSYDPQRPNDRARFYCWVNNRYPGAPTTVNGTSGNYLYFTQSRTCQTITVTLDLSGEPTNSRSDFLFYIETDCQYNNCSSYFMEVDNIQFAQGTAIQSSNTFTGLPAGNYPITVQDANGCTLTYASNPVVVTQPTALNVTTSFVSPTTVGGSNGKMWVTATGGTPTYSYIWSAGTVTSGAGDTITGLSAGNYSVTVVDNNNCTATAGGAVPNPSCALAVTSVGKVNASCSGASNGSFTITTTGATGAVEYSINGGATWQASNSFTGLAAGSYTVQVRDAAGCSASAAANPQVVSAPQIMSLNFAVTPVSTVGGADGAINLTVTGGTSPKTFIWTNTQSTEDISNLSSGQYCVTVTDAAGCTITGCGNVTQPTCNLAITSVVAANPLCNTGSTGSIAITTTGANGAVQYSVNGGSTWVNTSPVTGLAAGSYTVSVRDAAGCTASAPSNPYTLVAPTAVSGNLVATPASGGGTNGSVDLTPFGGTLPYIYQWNTGAVTQDITNLPTGNYCVTVTDANGCTFNSCATVTGPGCSLAITNVSLTSPLCIGGNDGSITITTTGGSGQVEYSINGGTSWSTINSFAGLGAGSYTVQVRDANSCTASGSNNPYIVTQPSVISLSTIVVDVSQAGSSDGSINLTATGGTPPYIYVWNTGATTEDLTGLGTGVYCVTVADANGCSTVLCDTVSQPVNGCAGFAVTNVAVTQPNCPGDNGTITVSISGGQNPILYSVDSGATFQNGVSLFTVGGGVYKVLVKDNAGCEAVYSSNPITINTLQAINPVITQVGDTLYVNDLGASYEWLFGGNSIANATDTSYGLLANGSYSVIVTDGNGCTFASNTLQVTGVGITEATDFALQLWPNPTNNLVSYTIDATEGELQLYGSDGRLVLSQTITQQQGTIDLTELAGGIYHIRFVGKSGQAIKRIVKY